MDINVSCQGDLSESHCSAEGQFSFNPFLLRRTVSLKRDGETGRYLKKWMKASDSMENGVGGLRLRLNLSQKEEQATTHRYIRYSQYDIAMSDCRASLAMTG